MLGLIEKSIKKVQNSCVQTPDGFVFKVYPMTNVAGYTRRPSRQSPHRHDAQESIMNRNVLSAALAVIGLAAITMAHAQNPTTQPAPPQGSFQQITHSSPVKCPSRWPIHVPRQFNNAHGEARDLCIAHGVHLPANLIPGNNLKEDKDYVRLPVNGKHLGYSFVALDGHVTSSDGWKLVVNKFGAVDRYER
jgi:hypothetical protein